MTSDIGLYYMENIGEDVSDIFSNLDKLEWIHVNKSNKSSRSVQHYGYKYNYLTHNIKEKCEPLPDFLIKFKKILTDTCTTLGIMDKDYEFNQCIINNYYQGQGISPHIDVKSYGDVIGCFTFGSGTTIKFRNNEDVFELYVKPNSLYIMSGDSRYKWTHEISPNKFDILDGKKIERTRRISVTFRNVPLI